MKRKQDRRMRLQHVMPSRCGARSKYQPFERVRIETGMLQFEGDWPGLFVRGDDAIGLMASVRAVLEFAEKWLPSLPPARVVEVATYLNRLSEIADLIDGEVVVKQ
jgi:hypothetical protein